MAQATKVRAGHTDDVLAGIVTAVRDVAAGAGLTRERRGFARGGGWATVVGRAGDQTWYELRLRHHPVKRKITAGLLGYLSMAKGGRTVVVGENSISYSTTPENASVIVEKDIRRWLGEISR